MNCYSVTVMPDFIFFFFFLVSLLYVFQFCNFSFYVLLISLFLSSLLKSFVLVTLCAPTYCVDLFNASLASLANSRFVLLVITL